MRRTGLLILLCAAVACGDESPVASRSCRAIAQAAPISITFAVGAVVTLATSIEAGCPAPIVRNETPAILEVTGSVGLFQVKALALGTGRIRVLSAVDTTVTQLALYTVIP